MIDISLDDFGLPKSAKGLNVCIVSYSRILKRESVSLKAALQACGFRVSFAGDMDGLMKQFADGWYPGGRYMLLTKLKVKSYFLLSSMLRKRDCSKESYYLLINSGGNHQWFHEAAQLKLHEMGASDRLYFYDIERNRISKYEKPVLGYLEYHVSWHCNLKCKGCDHYSNLYDKPLFGDVEQYRKNLLRLRELFDHIEQIRLLGGEPFLNRQIGDFVKATKDVFPDTDLRIVSNGLLILGLGRDLLELLRGYGVTVDISNYPPTAKILGKIKQVLTDAGIPFEITPQIREFRYILGSKRTNRMHRTFRHCPLRNCHFLHDDGRLSMCGIPIFYDAAKDKLKAEREVGDSDWVDLYRAADGYEVLEKFSKAIPLCDYCVDVRENAFFPWQGQYTQELRDEDVPGFVKPARG